MSLGPYEILSIVCSIGGAIMFIIAILIERKIIKLLNKIKNPKSWKLEMFFTGFFFLGYILNIVSIFLEWEEVQLIFNGLVFLFGAIFLLLVVYLSFKTYSVIFKAAENEIGEDLEYSNE